MNTGGRKLGGHLNATGKSLSIFKSPVDTFAAKINLKANDLEIEQLDVQRQTDLLHAEGKIDLGPDHNYSGTSHFTVANVAQDPEAASLLVEECAHRRRGGLRWSG